MRNRLIIWGTTAAGLLITAAGVTHHRIYEHHPILTTSTTVEPNYPTPTPQGTPR